MGTAPTRTDVDAVRQRVLADKVETLERSVARLTALVDRLPPPVPTSCPSGLKALKPAQPHQVGH